MSVCHFNKFGFCKFGKQCFRKHEDTICENVPCNVLDCSLRHPKKCMFFLDYHYCKFGNFCKFLHEANKNEKAIEAIEKQLKDVKKELDRKGKDIKLLSETLCKMKMNLSIEIVKIVEKNEIIEKDVQYLKVENENLKAQLNLKKEIDVRFLGKKDEIIDAEVVIEDDSEKGTKHICEKCDFIGKT